MHNEACLYLHIGLATFDACKCTLPRGAQRPSSFSRGFNRCNCSEFHLGLCRLNSSRSWPFIIVIRRLPQPYSTPSASQDSALGPAICFEFARSLSPVHLRLLSQCSSLQAHPRLNIVSLSNGEISRSPTEDTSSIQIRTQKLTVTFQRSFWCQTAHVRACHKLSQEVS
jgi:hypothetical protein